MTEGNRHHMDAVVYAILQDIPLKTIKFLLDQGNDVNKLTMDGKTYLFWAVNKGNLELMKHLVNKGAKTDITDQHGYSLLMYAAVSSQSNQSIYDYCLEIGAGSLNERTRKDGRNLLLAYAGNMKNFEIINYFIQKGIDIHSVDDNGNGIFNHAAKAGNEDFMKRLISEYQVNHKKNSVTNENALLFASRKYSHHGGKETDISFYRYLEGLGLDPLIVSEKGNTILQNVASRSKNIETIKYFINKGIDANQVDESGNNALINASSRQSKEIIEMLLEKTKDINWRNNEGMSAFSRALKYNQLEIAKFLEKKGADTKVIDSQGFDLGYHLVDRFRSNREDAFKEKMKYLISLGYDVRSTQKNGSTLLHAAINKENINLLEYLFEKQIDINAKDNHDHTILHYAAMQSGNEKILKYLLDKGADKTIITSFNESAFDLADENELLTQNSVNIEFLKTERK